MENIVEKRLQSLTENRDKIIAQLQSLETAKQNLINQLNAIAGAMQELQSLREEIEHKDSTEEESK